MISKVINYIQLLTFSIMSVYLVYCGFDILWYKPVIIKIERVFVGTPISVEYTPNHNYNIHPGAVFTINFDLTRTHTAYNSIERVIRNEHTNTESILGYVRRPHSPGRIYLTAQYEIPEHIPKGCGYELFSRNSISYRYNMITHFFPIEILSPKVKICII